MKPSVYMCYMYVNIFFLEFGAFALYYEKLQVIADKFRLKGVK